MFKQASAAAVWVTGGLLVASICYNAAIFFGYRSPGGAAGPRHDFGDVFIGESKEHTFHLHNALDVPRTISRVSVDCGCTTVGGGLEAKTLAPHEAFDVPIRWVVKTGEGRMERKAVVFFLDDGDRKPLSLTLVGNIKRRFTCSPDRLAFETLSSDEAVVKSIAFKRDPGAPPLEIIGATTSNKALAAKLEVSASDGDTDERTITVRTVPPLKPGRLDMTVFIETSDPNFNLIPITTTLIVRPN